MTEYLKDVDAEIYDDKERIIGTWFNEPLYRIVFQGEEPLGTNPVQNSYRIDVSHLKIKQMIKMEGVFSNGTSDADVDTNDMLSLDHCNACYNNGVVLNNNSIWFYHPRENLIIHYSYQMGTPSRYRVILTYTKKSV